MTNKEQEILLKEVFDKLDKIINETISKSLSKSFIERYEWLKKIYGMDKNENRRRTY